MLPEKCKISQLNTCLIPTAELYLHLGMDILAKKKKKAEFVNSVALFFPHFLQYYYLWDEMHPTVSKSMTTVLGKSKAEYYIWWKSKKN